LNNNKDLNKNRLNKAADNAKDAVLIDQAQINEKPQITEKTLSNVQALPLAVLSPKIILEKPKADAKSNTINLTLTWVLQVASYKTEEQAKQLVKTLVEDKNAAYSRLVTTRQGQFYRVYLGPFQDQNEAKARQKEIDKIYKVQSQLLRFRPTAAN
jgi:cell division septation protein DedD